MFIDWVDGGFHEWYARLGCMREMRKKKNDDEQKG